MRTALLYSEMPTPREAPTTVPVAGMVRARRRMAGCTRLEAARDARGADARTLFFGAAHVSTRCALLTSFSCVDKQQLAALLLPCLCVRGSCR